MTEVKAAQPDAVFLASHETEALNFIRHAKGLDVNPKMLFSFTVGVPTADFRKALGSDAEYAFGMTSWLPNASLRDDWFGDPAQFAKVFKEKYGYEPDYHAASGVAEVVMHHVGLCDLSPWPPSRRQPDLGQLGPSLAHGVAPRARARYPPQYLSRWGPIQLGKDSQSEWGVSPSPGREE